MLDWLKNLWSIIVNYFTSNGWAILKFMAILVFGFVLVKILINIIRRIFAKTRMERITQQFLVGVIKLGLWLGYILILLNQLGVEITGIVTALSALLLTLGLALENNIANVANGIVIVVTRMFKKGDYIIVNGVEGSIIDINFLFTTLQTPDNKKITLPNSSIVNNAVTNNGANKTRRVDFTFSVAYETDVELVKKIVLSVMESDGKVRLDPAPFCRLKNLGASSIDFFANCWVDNEDYWDVYYYVMENVYNEFKRNNISIPYNQLEVRNRVDKVKMPVIKEPLQKRVEKVRKERVHFDLETFGIHEFMHKKEKKSRKELKEEKKKAKENTKNAVIEPILYSAEDLKEGNKEVVKKFEVDSLKKDGKIQQLEVIEEEKVESKPKKKSTKKNTTEVTENLKKTSDLTTSKKQKNSKK